jgi:hypothetical protein
MHPDEPKSINVAEEPAACHFFAERLKRNADAIQKVFYQVAPGKQGDRQPRLHNRLMNFSRTNFTSTFHYSAIQPLLFVN